MSQITARFNDRRLAMEIDGLPELTGSDKQVAWATDIRLEAVRRLEQWFEQQRNVARTRGIELSLDQLNAHAAAVATQAAKVLGRTEAKYWIDNRGQDIRVLAAR